VEIADALKQQENHDQLEKAMHAAINEAPASGVSNIITFSSNRKGMGDACA
jgi:hypothetical protein